MPAKAPKATRKIDEQINGQTLYWREVTNDDLDEYDEIADEHAELNRARTTLEEQVAETDDDLRRRELRQELRERTREQRQVTARMLAVFMETSEGERLPDELVRVIPVRLQATLLDQAVKRNFGEGDEGPPPEPAGTP